MDKYKTTFKTWNKIAQLYEDKFMELDLYNDSYDIFCELLKQENASILELGCGPGNITQYILSKYSNCQFLGIDVAPKMIELAKKNNPTADFKVMDGRNINTLEERFNGIVAGFYLPYLSKNDRVDFFIDCHELLNNQGVFYLSFVAGEYQKSGYLSGSTGDQVYFYYHDLDEVENELIESGFSLLHRFHKEYSRGTDSIEIHTILIVQK